VGRSLRDGRNSTSASPPAASSISDNAVDTRVTAVSSSWAGTAEAYEASFARLCAGTVESVVRSLGLGQPGRSVLDVGCGPGTVAAAVRQAGFAAVGVDADKSMLRLASRRHSGLALVLGALPNLPFARGSFDAVTANFVVNHTPDPRASIREMRRVARPGGRIALTIWTGVVSPMNQLWNDVMAAAAVEPPPARTLPPNKDFERTAPGLAGIMTEADLTDVVVREVHWLFRISAADLWRAAAGGIATFGQTYQAQQPLLRNRMRDAYMRLTHERYSDGNLCLPSAALLATAATETAA